MQLMILCKLKQHLEHINVTGEYKLILSSEIWIRNEK